MPTLKEWKDELKAVQAHVKTVGFKGDDHPFANQIAIIKQNIADLEKKPAAAPEQEKETVSAE